LLGVLAGRQCLTGVFKHHQAWKFHLSYEVFVFVFVFVFIFFNFNSISIQFHFQNPNAPAPTPCTHATAEHSRMRHG
jgi:hypothetical protein